ncbi:hypothetical protein GL58_00715 [Comamonas testosteroni]|uniref:Uncharacterized protein n=1 Tax=Comamonas testosteroni TaxID=285 RepID=A0A0L7MVZ2_COMTE|nr:hypothetical protein [Comamonas testosteroni]KOC25955.1 hypothetical protein GL58_00715 [Comamonas testosteroni]
MVTIGIRVKPKAVTFVVLDGDEVKNVEDMVIPRAFDTPDALKYVRTNLLDVLREYRVEAAGIRVTEPTAQSFNIERVQLEGVIQEAFASSSLKGYYVGQISNISSLVGINRADFKPMVDGENKLNIEAWSKLSREAREALLCALGAQRVND